MADYESRYFEYETITKAGKSPFPKDIAACLICRKFQNKGGAIVNSNTIGSEKSRGAQSAAKLGYINP